MGSSMVDHVLFTFDIDLVQHGGERSGFAGTPLVRLRGRARGACPHKPFTTRAIRESQNL